jgi:hypothetical protein
MAAGALSGIVALQTLGRMIFVFSEEHSRCIARRIRSARGNSGIALDQSKDSRLKRALSWRQFKLHDPFLA